MACWILMVRASIFRLSAATWDDRQLCGSGLSCYPWPQTGRQTGHWDLGVSTCVCARSSRVLKRGGSGCGHLSRLICRESVASDHMVESAALGQGQAKTFPQSELVRVRQRDTVGSACSSNTSWYTATCIETQKPLFFKTKFKLKYREGEKADGVLIPQRAPHNSFFFCCRWQLKGNVFISMLRLKTNGKRKKKINYYTWPNSLCAREAWLWYCQTTPSLKLNIFIWTHLKTDLVYFELTIFC